MLCSGLFDISSYSDCWHILFGCLLKRDARRSKYSLHCCCSLNDCCNSNSLHCEASWTLDPKKALRTTNTQETQNEPAFLSYIPTQRFFFLSSSLSFIFESDQPAKYSSTVASLPPKSNSSTGVIHCIRLALSSLLVIQRMLISACFVYFRHA